ncbi:MAG TPA: MBL fold metallo-hydrolase [Geobacteraceae bacterium]|nr:MBL fold metallo-hydrolase [Geobacteraceae bacterium]
MTSRFPFRKIEPALFSGLLDDPVLHLAIRPMGKGILLDCGRIQHLAKRVLKSLTALFISHAHMDHFMGIDTFIRGIHVSPKTADIFGPPGMATKIAHKLAGYDWNLANESWCSFRVHDVYDDRIELSFFPGPEGFIRRKGETRPRPDRIIYCNQHIMVESETCDHKIPSLMYKVSELPSFQVDEKKLLQAGMVRGDWLRTLKKHFYGKNRENEPLRVLRRKGTDTIEELVQYPEVLYEKIRGERKEASIGYLTDIGFTKENREKIENLMEGVTLLVCECSFLKEDEEKARISAHLCTSDVNILIDRIRPAFFLPIHLSKSYIHTWERLYEELEIPPGVTLVQLPKYLTPQPLLPCEARKIMRPA